MKKSLLIIALSVVLSNMVFADGDQHTGKNCPQNATCLVAVQPPQQVEKPLIVKLFEMLGLL